MNMGIQMKELALEVTEIEPAKLFRFANQSQRARYDTFVNESKNKYSDAVELTKAFFKHEKENANAILIRSLSLGRLGQHLFADKKQKDRWLEFEAKNRNKYRFDETGLANAFWKQEHKDLKITFVGDSEIVHQYTFRDHHQKERFNGFAKQHAKRYTLNEIGLVKDFFDSESRLENSVRAFIRSGYAKESDFVKILNSKLTIR
jgi:hypothetical protein